MRRARVGASKRFGVTLGRAGRDDVHVVRLDPDTLLDLRRWCLAKMTAGRHPSMVLAELTPRTVAPVRPVEGVVKPDSSDAAAPPLASLLAPLPDDASLKQVGRRATRIAEREAILRALTRTGWNKRKAALRLRISYKAVLYKIRDCGIVDPRDAARTE